MNKSVKTGGKTQRVNERTGVIMAKASPTQSVPFFSMKNESWGSDEVGSSGFNINEIGCTVTSVAMLLTYYGVDTDPGRLNAWLSACPIDDPGYTPAGAIYWKRAADYTQEEVTWIDNSNDDTWFFWDDTQVHWDKLNEELVNGYPVLVEVDAYTSTYQLEEHWVLVTRREGDTYYINDPDDTVYNPNKLLSHYYDSTYDNTIFAMRFYHGSLPTPDEDNIYPTVDDFSVYNSSVTLGNGFSIYYVVSDSGGSGLNRVEYWRKYEENEWQMTNEVSLVSEGNGPYEGFYTDTPDQVGTYWYGIHVADNAGNLNCEQNSNTDGLPGDFGPVEVTVRAHAIPVGEGAPSPQVFTDCYDRNGGTSILGYPINNVHRWGNGYIQDFRGGEGYEGAIMQPDDTSSAYAVYGSIWARYLTLGGAEGPLGYPLNDESPLPPSSISSAECLYNKFYGGSVVHHATGAQAGLTVFLGHGIFNKWEELGYGGGVLGLPSSDEREAPQSGAEGFDTTGVVCDFEGGHLHWHRTGALANQAYETHGAIDSVYTHMGGSDSWIGFPVKDEYNNASGYPQSDFEGGYITTTDGVSYQAFPRARALIESVDISVYHDSWEYDIKTTTETQITWYIYNCYENLVHTYESTSWGTDQDGVFGGYILDGGDGYIHLKVVSQDGDIEWWPSESEMYSINRPPPIPHMFWGEVYIEGSPAPDGTLVEARINGVKYEEGITEEGKYGYNPDDQFHVPGDRPCTTEVEGGVNGNTIEFYVNGILATTCIFEIGGYMKLNLECEVPIENLPPVADAGGPYDGFVGTSISFDGSGSSDIDGIIASYAWTFGDGETAIVESPSHTYTASGIYSVTLTVTDDDGANHMDTTTARARALVTLEILTPLDGFTVEGAFDITFRITNTGNENIVFMEGDPYNRIDLQVWYGSADAIIGWGSQLWSTSHYGLELASGEIFHKTIECGVGVYEGDMTISLVHWEKIDGYSYGSLGKSEIIGTITRSPRTGSPVIGFYRWNALNAKLADYLEGFGYLLKYVDQSNFMSCDLVFLDHRSCPPPEQDLLNYVDNGGNLWIDGEADDVETSFLGAMINPGVEFWGSSDDPSRLWLSDHQLTTGVSLITYPAGGWIDIIGSIEDVIRIDGLPILAVDESHRGKILWLIDSDIFGNNFLYRSDNEILARNIADWLCGKAPVEPNQHPVAVAGQDQSVSSGDLIEFDGSNSYDPDGTIVSYRWDFEDGETATGILTSHRFRGAQNELKTYTVTLTVKDNNGATDIDVIHVNVYRLTRAIKIFSSLSEFMPIPMPPIIEVIVYYNWVSEIEGQDVYVISKIHLNAVELGFTLYVFDIEDDGHEIWHRKHLNLGILGQEEITFIYPFNVPRDLTITIDDEHFEGLAVGPNSDLFFTAMGIELKPEPSGFYVSKVVKLGPGIQVEVPSIYPEAKLAEVFHATLGSPAELRVYDSQGRITGLLNGDIKGEIPYSVYDEENKLVIVFFPIDSYHYEVAGTDDGTYGLEITSVRAGDMTAFTATDIPTSVNALHQYTVDWDALFLGEEGVTLQIDSDGDGIFEQTITADNELTQPHTFYGGVTIGEEPAPAGTLIEAKIGGVTYATTVVPAEGGIYSLYVNAGEDGDTVDFYVDGVWAAEDTFQRSSVTNLNLMILQNVEYDIELFEGWNLISLPFAPENSSIDVVLADISDNVVIVYSFCGETNTWSYYDPRGSGDLIEMVEDKGYWIYMENADVLTVRARVPLINPVPGQYAYYTLYFHNETVDRAYGWCKITYQSYETPIWVNVSIEQQMGEYNYSYWMLINIMNRQYEDSNNTWMLWIETDIKLDDEIRLEDAVAKVVDSGIIDAAGFTREYWILEFVHPYLNITNRFGFDKETGILIYHRQFHERGESNFTLTSTNIFSSMFTREIALFKGWNLISLPFAPENSSIDVVLADISDNVVIVYSFCGETNTWSYYDPRGSGDLIEMVEDKGYWIYMENADVLTVRAR